MQQFRRVYQDLVVEVLRVFGLSWERRPRRSEGRGGRLLEHALFALPLPQFRGLAMEIQAMDLMFSRHLGRWIQPSGPSRDAGLHRSQSMRPAFFQARTRAQRPCTRRPGLGLPGTGKVKCRFQVWPEKQVLDPWEAMSLTGEEYGVKKHTVQRLKVFLFEMPNPA